ncbi:hypothetical protein ACJRO7_032788 [Eucalyptus globulus]|uniref:Ammonium transporter AmtB-like domain-containing protein n=1 Tax=Eucalyptus globulus TaxID=34317 RepID=A0ABD3JPF4_EUCGL
MALPATLLPDEASPKWLKKTDNAWQLTAAALVGLHSIPGLVILYGSMVKGKWAVNSAFMAFCAFTAVLVCWVGWGYRMSFGESISPFPGKPGVCVFAAITLILVASVLLGRMNFRAWMLFVPLWLTCSYRLGVINFAGGYVIHLSFGVAGFTAAYWVGPRADKDREHSPPNNLRLILAGAGLLWMGWTGFNGGAPFAASSTASLAVLNTHVCTAMSSLMWLILDSFLFGKPSVVSAVNGMITGLVCITPAVGLVQGWAAILMGVASGCVPWYTMTVLHDRVELLRQVDNPMSVFHTQAIPGTLGGVLTGFFAVPKLYRLFYMVPNWEKYGGLAYGLQDSTDNAGFRQMGVQLLGVGLVVPLRLSEGKMQAGDKAVHGERRFALAGDGGRFEIAKNNSIYGMEDEPSSIVSRSLGDVQMV